MVKTIAVAGVCSTVSLIIGCHIGYKKCDRDLRPQVKNLERRVKYLEEGKVKQ